MTTAPLVVGALVTLLSIGGCSEVIAPRAPISTQHGVYILCEGVWGQNNATLARIELPSGRIIPDIL
ncbi:MAG: hypothetical protein RMJ46_06575, partial [Bacteroidota bacterium]|nr:hypothetical protein [Bacteroidota bacterium]